MGLLLPASGGGAADAAHPRGTVFLLGGPRPGSLNNLLLARGHVAHSQNLVQRTHAMQSAVRVATPHNPASVRAAQKAVAQLALGVRALASDVLHIPLAFTDADGD